MNQRREVPNSEVHAAAEAEGLVLLSADNASGFRYVSLNNSSVSRPFKAQLWRDGRMKFLGNFAMAEEGALAVARFLESEAQQLEMRKERAPAREQVEAAEADPLPPRLAAEVAAEAEDDDDDDMSAEDDYGILIQP